MDWCDVTMSRFRVGLTIRIIVYNVTALILERVQIETITLAILTL
jgi:hypothetical protein